MLPLALPRLPPRPRPPRVPRSLPRSPRPRPPRDGRSKRASISRKTFSSFFFWVLGALLLVWTQPQLVRNKLLMFCTPYLADEVSGLILVLLGDDNGILPDGVIALVRLTSFQLRDNFKALALLEVLVQSEGVVLLLDLPLAATAVLGGLLSLNSSIAGSGGGVPLRDVGCAPGVTSLLGGGIVLGGSLRLQLGVALITAPALVDLLVRVAGREEDSELILRHGLEIDLRLASLAVLVEGATTAPGAVAAASTTTTTTALALDWSTRQKGLDPFEAQRRTHSHFLGASVVSSLVSWFSFS